MPDQPEKITAPTNLMEWLGFRSKPDWTRARLLGTLIGTVLPATFALLFLVALIAAAVTLFAAISDALSPDTTGGASLGVGALIVALLSAPFLIWRTIVAQKTLDTHRDGQMTDRISKAVEQLGAEKTVKRRGTDAKGKDITVEESRPNIEVRIGGILSLERIALDSTKNDKGRDHVLVMEILCAYIRENAKAEDAKISPHEVFAELTENREDGVGLSAEDAFRNARFHSVNDFGWNPTELTPENFRYWAQSLPAPREDIQQALKVIGRRNADQRGVEARWGKDADPAALWPFDTPAPVPPEPIENAAIPAQAITDYKAKLEAWKKTLSAYRGYRLDLRNTNLQKADLSQLFLSGADLREARMEGADLSEARMEGANLSEARMEGATLSAARMEGANLSAARIEGANLRGARMQGADLGAARMEGADLSATRMEGVELWQARMEGADFRSARLLGATLSATQMEGANLSTARMEGADFSGTRMDETTSLLAAVLRGAVWQNVNLTNIRLSPDQIHSTFGDASVILPDGKGPDSPDWPAHWPKQKLNWGEFYSEWRAWQATLDPNP